MPNAKQVWCVLRLQDKQTRREEKQNKTTTNGVKRERFFKNESLCLIVKTKSKIIFDKLVISKKKIIIIIER